MRRRRPRPATPRKGFRAPQSLGRRHKIRSQVRVELMVVKKELNRGKSGAGYVGHTRSEAGLSDPVLVMERNAEQIPGEGCKIDRQLRDGGLTASPRAPVDLLAQRVRHGSQKEPSCPRFKIGHDPVP